MSEIHAIPPPLSNSRVCEHYYALGLQVKGHRDLQPPPPAPVTLPTFPPIGSHTIQPMLGSRAPIVVFAAHIEQRLVEDPLDQSEGCFLVYHRLTSFNSSKTRSSSRPNCRSRFASYFSPSSTTVRTGIVLTVPTALRLPCSAISGSSAHTITYL